MSAKTNTYLAKVIAGLAKEGGGHTIESAFFEQPDNSIDAKAKEIIIAYSESLGTFMNADDGYGVDDILALWGCGNIVSKTGEDIGKKMIGELASTLYYQPQQLIYKSVCACDISHQYAHLDLQNIMEIVMKPDKLQKQANDEIEQYIDVQAKRNKTLHQDDLKRLFRFVNDNDGLVKMIKNEEQITGLMKFMEFDKDNEKFKQLIASIPRLAELANLFVYNQFLRNGLVIKILNLDDPTKNILLNRETALQSHILGKKSFIRDDELSSCPTKYFSSDFGNIDLNCVHVFNYDLYKDGKWNVEYVNCNSIEKYEFVGDKRKKGETIDLGGTLLGSARIYISNIGEYERDQQKMQLGISSSEELRKPHIMLNTGNNVVRGLCRGVYPTSWKVETRNLKDVSFVICIDGESKIGNVSGNKSSFNLENMNPQFLEIANESAIRILKGCYAYKKWPSALEDKSIMLRCDDLLQILNNKKKSAPPKRQQMMKSDFETLLQEMDEDDLEKNKEVFWKIVSKNIVKIHDVTALKSMLSDMLENIEGEGTIIAEASGVIIGNE